MNQGEQELYRCMECGEMVEKSNQFMHDIKCQTNKKMRETFTCDICLRSIKLTDKEEHLHCHEIEQRNISQIIEQARNTSRILSNRNTHPHNIKKNNKGLDAQTIANYPVSKINNANNLSEDKKKCLICLDEFKNGQNSIILPCIHLFHSICIKTWMAKENFCPLCKNKIV